MSQRAESMMVTEMKFGDRVENIAASDDNPTKCGFFVRTWNREGRLNPGIAIEVTDGKGKFWSTTADVMRPAALAEQEARGAAQAGQAPKMPTRADIGVLIRDSMGKEEGWLQYLPAADAILNYWAILNKNASAMSSTPAEPAQAVAGPDIVEGIAKTIWLAEFGRAFSRTPSDPWENQAEPIKDGNRNTARKIIEAGYAVPSTEGK